MKIASSLPDHNQSDEVSYEHQLGHESQQVKTYIFKIDIKKEEDQRWSVSIPTLKGCTSWGYTQGEALKNIQDAAGAYLEDMRDAGQAISFAEGGIEVVDDPVIAVMDRF